VISTTPEHVVVAIEISRDCLSRHRHLLRALLGAAETAPTRDGERRP
jgi:hypothetical protein